MKKASKKQASKKTKAVEPKIVETTPPTPPPAPKVKAERKPREPRAPRTDCKHGHGPEHWRVAKSGKSAWCTRCDSLRAAAAKKPAAPAE